MIAWTVATPDMMEMAKKAADRFRAAFNVDVEILRAADRYDAFLIKANRWLTAKGVVWYFDADWWAVDVGILPAIHGSTIIGAPNDTPNMVKYAGFQGIMKSHLFCSCLIGANMDSLSVRDVFGKAAKMQKDQFESSPKEDERFINIAIAESRVMALRLSPRWNWCGDDPHKQAIAIHAAGRDNKMEWLETAIKTYE